MAGKTKDRKQLRRRRRMKRRRERSLDRMRDRCNVPENTTLVHNPGGIKMSEVLLDFAAPILGDDLPIKEFRATLLFAALAWNLDISGNVSEFNAKNELAKVCKNPSHDEIQGMGSMFRFLLARKKAHFSHIRRVIMDVIVSKRPDEYYVQVLSSPFDSP